MKKLLDLYCGAGGCSAGYNRAGFEVTGVDNKSQPNYPYTFHQYDAIEFVKQYGHNFDVIHASPPCQAYSKAGKACMATLGAKYDDLMALTREILTKRRKPFIIENVRSSPMRADLKLYGFMFGLNVIRERWFEFGGGIWLMSPPKPEQRGMIKTGDFISVYGKGQKISRSGKNYYEQTFIDGTINEIWSYAMGIDWMSNAELSQAIPPAYTEYIGNQIKNQL